MNIFDLTIGGKRPLTLSTTDKNNNDKVVLVADAMITFELNQGLEVSEHPVEDGVDVADHAKVKLKNIRLEGIITEAPLTIYSGLASIPAGIVGSKIGGVAGAVVKGGISYLTDNLLGVGQGRIIEARKKLDEMINKKQLLTLTAKNYSLNNLMITELNYLDDVSKGNSLSFVASLREVKIVSPKIRKSKIASGVAKSATPKEDAGLKTGKELTPDQINQVYDAVEVDFYNYLRRGQ